MNTIGDDCQNIIGGYVNDLYKDDFNKVLKELKVFKFHKTRCICNKIFKISTIEKEIDVTTCYQCLNLEFSLNDDNMMIKENHRTRLRNLCSIWIYNGTDYYLR